MPFFPLIFVDKSQVLQLRRCRVVAGGCCLQDLGLPAPHEILHTPTGPAGDHQPRKFHSLIKKSLLAALSCKNHSLQVASTQICWGDLRIIKSQIPGAQGILKDHPVQVLVLLHPTTSLNTGPRCDEVTMR